MRACVFRMGIAVCIVGCICRALCQTNLEPSYAIFFQKVVADKSATVPTIQESTGLTDHEMAELQGIAADCRARLDEVARQHSHVVFDALMESIESGEDTSGAAVERLQALDGQRDRIVLAHVQVLKAALGDARFQELDAHLRAEEASRLKLLPHAPGKRQ